MFRYALTPADDLCPEHLPTGFARLDASLGGGLAKGQIAELCGGPSSGKATLALSTCVRALAAGETCAWIGGAGLWPLAALESGISLGRFLVLQVEGRLAMLRGAQLILACPGAVAVVVLDWPATAPPKNSQLVKLQRLAERAGAVLVFLSERPADAPSLGAAVALRLHVRRAARDRLAVEVLRHKGGPTHRCSEEIVRGPDRLRPYSTL